ncbi:phosphoadenosine phosphosulfate reductase family protein [Chromobacterium vaccinii]|uniref:phosphoadenosine phosphosulfate reductase domain-containing protein n=1 Tax=Chromobacterium vaccinii TaxID=1108595 RepID=UPI003C781358
MKTMHVVSVSGGKDSTATLLLALERVPRDRVRPIFCDTGNEHTAVYEHLDYLEQALGVTITRLRVNFSEQIAAKRMFIARDQRTRREYDTKPVFDAEGNPVPKRDGRGNVITRRVKRGAVYAMEPVQKTVKVGGGRRVRWTNKAKRRALAVLFPTGNPFLDLCLWKGRFPSRTRQFCTEHLKRDMAVSFQLELIDAGHRVVSWQGVRRDESPNRRAAKKIERIGPALWAFRPLVEWNAADVFSYADRSIRPNPLYLAGCDRVGCMPCVNVSKGELQTISQRWPEHIERIAEWERLVGLARKRGAATFLPAPGETRTAADRGNIWQRVEWSRTTRGGRQFDLLADLVEPTACASSYGLCA